MSKATQTITLVGLTTGQKVQVAKDNIKAAKGKFFGLKNIKQDGTERDYKGINVKEWRDGGMALVSEPNNETKGALRQVNFKTLTELRINGLTLIFA